MKRSSVLYIGLGLSLLLAILNLLALAFYFYWTLSWYDYLMHFLGGLTLGVVMIAVLRIESHSTRGFIILFLSVMVMGGVWEVVEYMADLTDSTEPYAIDTIKDLVMDALGGGVAYYSILRSRVLT